MNEITIFLNKQTTNYGVSYQKDKVKKYHLAIGQRIGQNVTLMFSGIYEQPDRCFKEMNLLSLFNWVSCESFLAFAKFEKKFRCITNILTLNTLILNLIPPKIVYLNKMLR